MGNFNKTMETAYQEEQAGDQFQRQVHKLETCCPWAKWAPE